MIYQHSEVLKNSLDFFNGDELAASVVSSKYLLKDLENQYVEAGPQDMIDRLINEVMRIESKWGGLLAEDDLRDYLNRDGKVGPVMFQGSPMYGIGNNYKHVSLSNCVVISPPEDDISSIVNTAKSLANLMKRRCGVGTDLSKLRPEGTPVSNSAGSTTGAWSFADFYSYVCNMIGQNGRRGALMLTLDVRHPDALKFAMCKHDITKVTGANISLKITSDFMAAVAADEDYVHHWPVGSTEPQYTLVLNARDTWNQIVTSATQTADPGLMFWDNIVTNLPAAEYWEHLTTNPCGELPLAAFDSCRLMAVVLSFFVKHPYTPQATFDFEDFAYSVMVAMQLCDDLVELEIEKLEAILNKVDTEDERILWTQLLEKCRDGRRTGLGTTALADTFSRLGIVYGSPESIELADKIYRVLKEQAYTTSCSLAEERGSFPIFDWEIEKDNAFIRRLPSNIQRMIEQKGRRNISILTNAPTGSVSILAQSSSGIEPVFRFSYTRKKKVNDSDHDARVDSVDEVGVRWQHHKVFHHDVLLWADVNGVDLETLEELPPFFVSSDQIDWSARIDLQAAIQQHIDHSISSTINLPAGTSVETVSKLYMEAWEKDLKGVTIYVEGSKGGVLVSDQQGKKPLVTNGDAPPRPEELETLVVHEYIKGQEWTILIGLLEDKPYEVFAAPATVLPIPKDITSGICLKHQNKTVPNRYVFIAQGVKFNLSKALAADSHDYGTLSRMISMSLRHQVPVQFIVDQLQKDPNADLWSFNRVLARTLKTFIPDGTTRDKACSSCGTNSLVYQEGCLTCSNCGYAKCG